MTDANTAYHEFLKRYKTVNMGDSPIKAGTITLKEGEFISSWGMLHIFRKVDAEIILIYAPDKITCVSFQRASLIE